MPASSGAGVIGQTLAVAMAGLGVRILSGGQLRYSQHSSSRGLFRCSGFRGAPPATALNGPDTYMLQRLLFGPQRPTYNLREAFSDNRIPAASVGVVSAGWQEAEGDFEELSALVPRPLVNLDLYARAEAVFTADRALYLAYRERQDRLQALQGLYRLRLRQLMLAARQIRKTGAPHDLVAAEQRHAVAQLRALDRHHLNRIESVYDEFAESISVAASAPLGEHVAAVSDALAGCPTVLLTGGNVMVLLNRLQLFDLRDALASRHLVAWSAGAMALSERVVLFHDSKPLGRRDAELLGAGMGILPGYIFLPDAKRRLQARDTVRIGLFGGRFSPDRCVTLDSGASLGFADQRLFASRGVDCLTARGAITSLGVA